VSAAGPGGAQARAAARGQTPRHVPHRSHRPPGKHHGPLGWGCGAALRVVAAATRRLPGLLPLRGAVLPCQLPRDALRHRVGPRWAAPRGPLHPSSHQHPHTHSRGSRSLPGSRAGTQRGQERAGGSRGRSRFPAWPLSCRGWSRPTPGWSSGT